MQMGGLLRVLVHWGNAPDRTVSVSFVHFVVFVQCSIALLKIWTLTSLRIGPHLLPTTTAFTNHLQPLLVGAGSSYKAWRWSQQPARYLPSITTRLTLPLPSATPNKNKPFSRYYCHEWDNLKLFP